MMPKCNYKHCRRVAEVNIGKINAKDDTVLSGYWATTIYLCRKHAKKIAEKLCIKLCGEDD